VFRGLNEPGVGKKKRGITKGQKVNFPGGKGSTRWCPGGQMGGSAQFGGAAPKIRDRGGPPRVAGKAKCGKALDAPPPSHQGAQGEENGPESTGTELGFVCPKGKGPPATRLSKFLQQMKFLAFPLGQLWEWWSNRQWCESFFNREIPPPAQTHISCSTNEVF